MSPYSSYLYCNPDAPLQSRIEDLVNRLSPVDFQSLLSNGNNGLPNFGIPKIMFGEALHGALTTCGIPGSINSTGCATSFPNPLALSRTLNRTLWNSIASVIGYEARALHNEGLLGSIVWAPNINNCRDPRWGRCLETAGEDPVIVSEYSSSYISAIQGSEDVSPYLLVPSQAKHAVAYDCEQCDGISRNSFDAIVSKQDLEDYFYVPFKAAVNAGVSGFMCSYNALNGIPSCANGDFLNAIVREEWGAGNNITVVSDCGAIREIWKDYFYTPDNESAVAAALRGGCDFECGGTFESYIVKSLERGDINISDLRLAATRMLRPVFRMGLLDPPERQVPYMTLSSKDVDTEHARKLAFEAAVQSAVLLVNRPFNRTNSSASSFVSSLNPILPLQPGPLLRRIAVVGPNANVTTGLLGSYHGENLLVLNQSLVQALERRGQVDGFDVITSPGCSNISCTDSSGFPSALVSSSISDVVIVALGLCSDECPGLEFDSLVKEGEGSDRSLTGLPGLQEQLLQEIVALGKPTILLLIHGGSLSIDWAASNVDSILSMVYPGQAGGDAAVALLFGDFSPSGRTTSTWYKNTWQVQRPWIIEMGLSPIGSIPGITHLYVDQSFVLFPFGHGLSFTNFQFDWQDQIINLSDFDQGDYLTLLINVTNVGSVTSDVSVMGFLVPLFNLDVKRPVQKCFDFGRASMISPRASIQIEMILPLSFLYYHGHVDQEYMLMLNNAEDNLKRRLIVLNSSWN